MEKIKIDKAQIGRNGRAVLIRIPEDFYHDLHRRAALHRRSLNLEVNRILGRALRPEKDTADT